MNRKPNSLIAVLAYIVVFHVPVTVLTWQDLNARPDAQVRGSKTLWRVVSALNTMGSVAYWLLGRRRVALAVI